MDVDDYPCNVGRALLLELEEALFVGVFVQRRLDLWRRHRNMCPVCQAHSDRLRGALQYLGRVLAR